MPADGYSEKSAWGDANNRKRMPIQTDHTAHGAWRAAVMFLPEPVTYNGGSWTAAQVVARGKQASRCRTNSQRVEEFATGVQSFRVLRFATLREIKFRVGRCKNCGEDV